MELLHFWFFRKANFTLKVKKKRTDFVILSQKIAEEADEILQSRKPRQSQDGQKDWKNKCQTEDEKFHPFNCVNLREPHLDKGNFETELEAKSVRIQSSCLKPSFAPSHHKLMHPRVILTHTFRRRASCSGSCKSSSKRARTPCCKPPRGEHTFLRGTLKFQICYLGLIPTSSSQFVVYYVCVRAVYIASSLEERLRYFCVSFALEEAC